MLLNPLASPPTPSELGVGAFRPRLPRPARPPRLRPRIRHVSTSFPHPEKLPRLPRTHPFSRRPARPLRDTRTRRRRLLPRHRGNPPLRPPQAARAAKRPLGSRRRRAAASRAFGGGQGLLAALGLGRAHRRGCDRAVRVGGALWVFLIISNPHLSTASCRIRASTDWCPFGSDKCTARDSHVRVFPCDAPQEWEALAAGSPVKPRPQVSFRLFSRPGTGVSLSPRGVRRLPCCVVLWTPCSLSLSLSCCRSWAAALLRRFLGVMLSVNVFLQGLSCRRRRWLWGRTRRAYPPTHLLTHPSTYPTTALHCTHACAFMHLHSWRPSCAAASCAAGTHQQRHEPALRHADTVRSPFLRLCTGDPRRCGGGPAPRVAAALRAAALHRPGASSARLRVSFHLLSIGIAPLKLPLAFPPAP